jgi:hypothetical protein
MEFEPLRCILEGTEMTRNGAVTAGAMLLWQDTFYICARACVCVCVCGAFGGEGNPLSCKGMWFSRGGHMVVKSYAK